MIKNIIPNKTQIDYSAIYTYDSSYVKFFHCPIGQRDMSTSHIKELADAMQISGKFFAPIQVNINTLNCFDGNCRLKAVQYLHECGIDVEFKVMYYDMTELQERKELITSNKYAKQWRTVDYINARIENGDDTMKKLLHFAIERKKEANDIICNSRTEYPNMRYMYSIVFGRNITEDIKDIDKELPVITEKELHEAYKRYRVITAFLRTIHQYRNSWLEQMIQAWYDFSKSHDINDNVASKMNFELGFINVSPSSKKKYWTELFDEIYQKAIVK